MARLGFGGLSARALCAVEDAGRLGAWLLGAVVHSTSPGSLVALISLYTIAAERPRREAGAAWIATTLLGLAADAAEARIQADPAAIAASLTAQFVACGFAVAFGLYVGARRAYIDGLEERAGRLERERVLLARQAVADERVRIARELHDIVAHHVSVMVIQAGAAESVLPPGSDDAASAIAAVRTSGREALSEMRRTLELLRADEAGREGVAGIASTAEASPAGAAIGSGPDGRSPQPGVRDLSRRSRHACATQDSTSTSRSKACPGHYLQPPT
jgi:signal transduction histidine kinase